MHGNVEQYRYWFLIYIYIYIYIYVHTLTCKLCIRVEMLNNIDKKKWQNFKSIRLKFAKFKLLLFKVEKKSVDYYYECSIRNLIVTWNTMVDNNFFFQETEVMKLFVYQIGTKNNK